jgi:hypothetical protein
MATTLDRAIKLYNSLEKFDWDTIGPKEKNKMIDAFENLSTALNRLINKYRD